MINSLLLDAAPELPAARSVGGLIILALVVVAFVVGLVLGSVFLLVWRKRSKAAGVIVAKATAPQPSSPNQ